MEQDLLFAAEEGYVAAEQGIGADANPYDSDTAMGAIFCEVWNIGHNMQQHDARRGDHDGWRDSRAVGIAP